MPPRHAAVPRGGFTLIELLLVLGIIAILLALLLAAAQRVREAAARTQCANNLRQIGLACHMHNDTLGHLPGGGWGYLWVGDATRGCGPRQPGGWIYQILPFMEQDSVYRLAVNAPGAAQMVGTPLPFFNCPSRRTGGPYNNPRTYNNYGGFTPQWMARSDYAANCGDNGSDEVGPGPDTLAQGDSPSYPWPKTSGFTGIVFQRSAITMLVIQAGTSNVFLAGDRYINPNLYFNGFDPSDNENMYVGMDNDIFRTTASPPHRDQSGVTDELSFGSNHPAGVNMLYCDGSVRHIGYDVDPPTFSRAGNRYGPP
jgi:prepilin-type N-terminal cleavage/methylation domain-containing protein/prepilin-type processing-associated H-X9-DG protein